MNYSEISKITFEHLYKSYASLKGSPLNEVIRILVELRVSQVNGCVYCCNLHAGEAKERGISEIKLNVLPVWYTSDLFDEKEKVALGWAEAVTRVDKNLLELRRTLAESFNEREIVDLTACIAIMNALNRIAISLK